MLLLLIITRGIAVLFDPYFCNTLWTISYTIVHLCHDLIDLLLTFQNYCVSPMLVLREKQHNVRKMMKIFKL